MDRTAALILLGSCTAFVALVLCVAAYGAQARTRAEEKRFQQALNAGEFTFKPTPSERDSERDSSQDTALPCAREDPARIPLVALA